MTDLLVIEWINKYGLDITIERARSVIADAQEHRPEEKTTSPNGLWMVYFEDKARPPEVFFGEGAEGCARLRYKQAYDHWSCHLLSRVPTHPLPEAELYLPSPPLAHFSEKK